MELLKTYLDSLNSDGSDLEKLLSRFEKIVTLEKGDDIKNGLLRYEKIPPTVAFLFRLPQEEVVTFHTVGMKFNINIYFFDRSGRLIAKYENVRPGVYSISSKEPVKYAVEALPKKET